MEYYLVIIILIIIVLVFAAGVYLKGRGNTQNSRETATAKHPAAKDRPMPEADPDPAFGLDKETLLDLMA
jgi:hypothetical protein